MMRRLLPALLVSTIVVISSIAGPAEARSHKPKFTTGHYVGTETPEAPNGLDDIVFNFDVQKKHGRYRIRHFTMAMNVVCSGYPVYVEYVVQPMNTMKVSSRTGRFRDTVTGTTEGGTGYTVKVAGGLKGKRVVGGTMSYDVGICQRGDVDDPMRWVARKGRAQR
jgi:hypothetical protein